MEACIREVNKAFEIGENTAASAHAAAKSLSERGRAFSYIAKEVSASMDVLKKVTEDFKNIHDLSAALSQLANTAYGMNINGFNASVETAREGNHCQAPYILISNLSHALGKVAQLICHDGCCCAFHTCQPCRLIGKSNQFFRFLNEIT